MPKTTKNKKITFFEFCFYLFNSNSFLAPQYYLAYRNLPSFSAASNGTNNPPWGLQSTRSLRSCYFKSQDRYCPFVFNDEAMELILI